jgi:hypothetical protein
MPSIVLLSGRARSHPPLASFYPLFVAAAVLVGACDNVEASASCPIGAQWCDCTSDGRCDPGLSCVPGTSGTGFSRVCRGPSDATTGPAGPVAPGPGSGESAGHKWCLEVAKGRIRGVPTKIAGAMWASGINDAWFLQNDAEAIVGVPPPGPPGQTNPILGVGDRPSLIHYDGRTFCQSGESYLRLDLDQSALWAIWGSSATDIWAVGKLGAAVRWDGKTWRPTKLNDEGDDLVAITGTGPENLYVLADAGAGLFRSIRGGDLLNWNGSQWRAIRFGGYGINFSIRSEIWLDRRGQVWASHTETVTDGPRSCALLRITADSSHCELESVSPSDDVPDKLDGSGDQWWALGNYFGNRAGWVKTFDGANSIRHDFTEQLHDIVVFSPSDVRVAGDTGVWRWDGTRWLNPDPASRPVGGMWARNSTELWGWNSGNEEPGLFFWNGEAWREFTN